MATFFFTHPRTSEHYARRAPALFNENRRDEDIAVDVVEGALLQKYVGFIEKEDGVPFCTFCGAMKK